MLTFLAILAILGLVFTAMSPAARKRFAQNALGLIAQIRYEATRSRPECDQFKAALRARTRWAFVTPALIALNVTVFVLMLKGAGALGDPETLNGWGGNFWLRTRNGEWWRLVTSMFVHAGVLQLLVNVAGLVQIGLILERQVGRLIVMAVFLTAGIFASLVNLATHPMATGIGASGAVFGLYGLLLASSIWTMRHRSEVTMPLTTVKQLVPAAAVFILYNLLSESLGSAAELTGLLTGLVCGAVLTKGVSDHQASVRRVGQVTAAALVIALLSAIPLRGATDVRPELERTVAVEDRTAATYGKAIDQFRNGRISADGLAQLIDRTIIPELQVTGARLKALDEIPTEHQPLVATAEEYVGLRSESWRLRAEWLRKFGKTPRRGAEAAQYRINNRTIAQSEVAERAALEALERIRAFYAIRTPPLE